MKKLDFTRWSIITATILFVGLLLWFPFVNRLFPAITDDFTYRANILSYDNFFDTNKNDFSGDILSKTKYSYKVEKKEDNILTIQNVFDVRKPSGDPIFAVERLYGVNKITGEHTFGYGDKNRNGYLFAPKNAADEFTYWHINYDAPAQMKLRGEETIDGLLVRRYECNYNADQTSNLTFLPGVPSEHGVTLDINLQLWIEPYTGYLIKYEDHTTGWFYDMKSKKRLHPWNRFHNQFEETSISNQVQIASIAKDQYIWWHHYFPFSILLLIFIVLSVGYHSERKSFWRPYFASGLILFTGLMASGFLYTFLQKNETIRLETIFNRDCESIRISLQRELERSVDGLNAIKTNYVSRKEMTREEYRRATKQFLKSNSNIKALVWIPKVTSTQRAVFETKAKQEGFADFRFTELNNQNTVTAGIRNYYFPIYYIEPYDLNQKALGFDFGSNPERKVALEKAAATGEATATQSIVTVQEVLNKKDNKSFLIILPIYEDELGTNKNHVIQSYLSGAIDINGMIQEAISRVNLTNNVSLSVMDIENKDAEILFNTTRKGSKHQFEKNSSLQVANRLWKLEFESTTKLSGLETSWFSIILPALVAMMGFILGIFVFKILTDDSKKLRNINGQLTNEISEHNKAKEKLEEHLNLLESQNTQLVDFCSIVSHNLRGPLVNIAMLVDYIEESTDETEQKEVFNKIKPVISHLNEVFNELVESVQVRQDKTIESTEIVFNECLNKVLIGFKSQISSYNARIQVDFENAPIMYYPQKYIESILTNLVSNALKYKSPERVPIVNIKTEKINENIVLSVSDNGLGIDLKMHKNNLFKIRKVFHKHPEAKGFGLFLTKTQVEAMNGRIWVESTPNIGSTFYIEFKIQDV